MYCKFPHIEQLLLKCFLLLMNTVVCFRKRKDYFPLSLPDSSLSGLTIHNPHLMTYKKWAACHERDSQTQRTLSLISALRSGSAPCRAARGHGETERCLGKEKKA